MRNEIFWSGSWAWGEVVVGLWDHAGFWKLGLGRSGVGDLEGVAWLSIVGLYDIWIFKQISLNLLNIFKMTISKPYNNQCL